MVRKFIRAGLFAALGMFAVALAYGSAATAGQKDKDKKQEKLPDISEIMKIAHAKTDGYLDKITAEAKGAKWEDAQKDAKNLALAGENLGKNKAPKGDEKNWEKLTKKYAESAKMVVEGADKKDAKAVTAAIGAIRKSCGECHKVHKP
jgi:cytochrome c556